jgi:hypothetical protein
MTRIGAPPHTARLRWDLDGPELPIVAELAADFPHCQELSAIAAGALRRVPKPFACSADKPRIDEIEFADTAAAAWALETQPRSREATRNAH